MLKQIPVKIYALPIAIIIALALYGNTLFNKYALDDAIVITQNQFTKQGFNGIGKILTTESFTGFFGTQKHLVAGGRYRPLSIVTFAVEYQFFGLNPFISHLINILLYAFSAWLVFIVTSLLISNTCQLKTCFKISCITALLFLLHPIHTEVVANIKGRDEILALMFSMLALYFAIKYTLANNSIHLVICMLSLFLALLSKENAITFVIVIPICLWYIKPLNIKKHLKTFVFILLPAILFLLIRHLTIGGFTVPQSTELMNDPFIAMTKTNKYATILYTWFVYLKLLIFPHPLTFDYYPYHIGPASFFQWQVLTIIIVLFFLFIMLYKGLIKHSVTTICIILFAITFIPVSNLLFTIGTFMNERFMYMPSVFWCIAIAHLIVSMWQNKPKFKPVIIIIAIYILTFYPAKTYSRNQAWKNDFTLFSTDVKTSAQSAKSNCSYGGKLWEEAKQTNNNTKQKHMFNESEKHLRKAVSIHPLYADAWLLLGNVLYDSKKDIEGSATCFLNVLKMQPLHNKAWQNIDIVLQNTKNRELQLNFYNQLYKIDSNKYNTNYRLGVLNARYFNNLQKGILYFEQAYNIDSTQIELLKDMGTCYGLLNKPATACKYFIKAYKINPTDNQVLNNLGVCYLNLGQTNEAKKYFGLANKTYKNDKR